MTKFFVVAEIGVSWKGSVDYAFDLMMKAREAGANAVKFQAFLPEHVDGNKELLKSSVTADNAQQLKAKADLADIEWFCTPFYPAAVDFLDPLVKRYKIRERDSREIMGKGESPLLNRVLDTGKLVFISATYTPVTPLFLRYHPSIAWLYCVPKYPPELEEIDMAICKTMNGYSNHYPSRAVPYAAAAMGALANRTEFFLEVHVGGGPDRKVSLTFRELRGLISDLRILEKVSFGKFPQ